MVPSCKCNNEVIYINSRKKISHGTLQSVDPRIHHLKEVYIMAVSSFLIIILLVLLISISLLYLLSVGSISRRMADM